MTKHQINQQMTKHIPIIQLNNTKDTDPTYRLLVQTSNELPGYDKGFNKIRYNPETIKNKIKQLEGRFLYDETQSGHNKRINPESRGHKFAKITSTGYCPDYGGYADVKVFDNDYHDLMKETYESIQNGLPLHEGPSTEIDVVSAVKDESNNLIVNDFDYTGIVWIDNPRDMVGVCKIMNSIEDVLEDNNMTEDMIKLSKTEYDELLQFKQDNAKLESDLTALQTKYQNGEQEYLKGKELYDAIVEKAEALEEEITPYRAWLSTQKEEIVNSILNSIPEAEREAKKEALNSMTIDQLQIMNSLPSGAGERGIAEGTGASNAGTGGDDEFDPKTNPTILKLKDMGYI